MNKLIGKTISALFLTVLAVAPVCAEFDETEQRMLEWIDGNAEDANALLEETVNISSGTMNHEGVKAVGDVMRRELDALGLETEWISMPPEVNRAGHLFGRKGGKGKKVLMIGHLDTVFESDDAFQSYERNGNIAKGPGVDDMKSGNVIIIYALKALQEVGALDDLPIVVAYTGDEEKAGQPLSISRRDLVAAGEWADISLGFESAVHYDDVDWATTSRRSSSSWTLTTTGRQAHSSGVFSERTGAGAVYEISRILTRFYAELRDEEFLTFNAANIQGGTDVTYDEQLNRGSSFGKTNIVPRSAVAHGDIRAISNEQLARVRDRMLAIVSESLPHTSASIEFLDKYPPMSPTDGNQALADRLSAINEELGRGPMSILHPLRRGAADISFVAPYSDSLAGLGALGSGGHSPNESLDLTTMSLAIKRAAILIYRLNQP
ncbi:MAG: M20/M25/M40 family metallo-hydrolase [Woeseiaceae bacterium]